MTKLLNILEDWLRGEILERRDCSASKMCELTIEKIKELKNETKDNDKIKVLLIGPDTKAMAPFYRLLNEDDDIIAYWVTTAYNVEQYIKENKYDTIIMEIMMPIPRFWNDFDKRNSKDGLETGIVLLNKIRKIKTEIPIIIYSSVGNIKCDDFTYHFRKPEFSGNIIQKLKEMCNK